MKVAFIGHNAHVSGWKNLVGSLSLVGARCEFWSAQGEGLEAAKRSEHFDEVVKLTTKREVDFDEAEDWFRELEEKEGERFLSRDLSTDRYFNNKPTIEIARWRHLQAWQVEEATKYLYSLAISLERALTLRRPDLVYCENNAAPYRLVHRLSARRAILCGYIHHSRMWPSRWYFESSLGMDWHDCRSEYRSLLLEKQPAAEVKSKASHRLNEIRNKGEKPEYSRSLTGGPRGILEGSSVRSLIGHVREWVNQLEKSGRAGQSPWHLPSEVLSPWGRFLRKLRVWRRWRYYRSIAEDEIPAGSGTTVAYFLHVQPEMPADILTSRFREQGLVIRNVAASVPAGGRCLVKEHPAQSGGRSREFYADVYNIPNVSLVSEKIHSHELILAADAIVTLAGTVALESVMFGVPAVILGDVFFEEFEGIYKAGSFREMETMLEDPQSLSGASEKEALLALMATYTSSTEIPGFRDLEASRVRGRRVLSLFKSHLAEMKRGMDLEA